MPTVTLGDLKARVYNKVENNTAFYDTTSVVRQINNGVKILNAMTGFIQKTVAVNTVANQWKYSVPASILIPLRVDLDDIALEKTSMSNLNQSFPEWMLENSATTGIDTCRWAPVGIKYFVVHPACSTANRVMDVTGVAEPTPLVSDSDVIALPNEYSDAIEDYAAHALKMKAAGVVAVQAMYDYAAFMRRMNELKRYKAKIAPAFRIEAEATK